MFYSLLSLWQVKSQRRKDSRAENRKGEANVSLPSTSSPPRYFISAVFESYHAKTG
ncbi:unnamed protein product [Haemonchus placei]|uniref:Secreted protein n=1 Tax=Haemonchus placei TaxID=6290 RepID=A0A0N4VXK0_HAEPC|nr:unnamed protein product [Haemonchus placei]